jgi:peroxiredoxin Q/BCP
MKCLTSVLVSLLLCSFPVLAGNVDEGEKAPAFTLPGSDGQTYSLDQFTGKKPVVLAWFPKAFTGG